MKAILEKTTKQDQIIAQSAIDKLNRTSVRVTGNGNNSVEIKIEESNNSLMIPKKALNLLFAILNHMAEGKSITVVPADTLVSTQQAAEMLHVSRPHIVKLLEEGKIPFKMTGSHRRIELKNLIVYKDKLKENRKQQLKFLTKQAQELNLGYE